MTHNFLENKKTKPKVTEIEKAEIAINLADKTLWSKDASGNVVQLGGSSADSTGKAHQTITTDGTYNNMEWSPLVTSPAKITKSFALAVGANASIVSPEVENGVEITIPDGSTLVIL